MMHEGDVRAEAEQVRRLLVSQFPRWAGLPIAAVAEHGTDHLLFRLGDARLEPVVRSLACRAFRSALDCDEDMWQRGRGWVLAPALAR
jgi:aminoglycoside phosphotransferase (APT) family kinase protein